MKQVLLWVVALGIVLIAISGCGGPYGTDSSAETGASAPTYLVVASGGLPVGFADRVAAAGGQVVRELGEVGIGLVAFHDEDAARGLAGTGDLTSVVPNVTLDWLPGDGAPLVVDFSSESLGDDETLVAGYQWSMLAIDAPGAWEAGFTGAGVKVAILDSGIDADHPDLAPNVNLADSRSFVPHEPWIDDNSGHGTHVAGIVAAADNSYGTIGVAPGAEIIAVKVLTGAGTGELAWIIRGILYAHEAGAHIINMSFGANLQRRGMVDATGERVITASEVAEIVNALTRVINYVESNGTLVIASAGNESADTTGDKGVLRLPADAGNTISVSATGPIGWGEDPDTDLDQPAFYTNYGIAIDLAAPGGNRAPDPGDVSPSWYYDLVFSTYPRTAQGTPRWAWMYGTSQAAPHVAGIAALIMEARGPGATPAVIEGILRRTADDLGKPGRDEWYGHGRVNAAAAVR